MVDRLRRGVDAVRNPAQQPTVVQERVTEREVLPVPSEVLTTRLPSADSPEYQEIEERTVLDDLAVHFGRFETISRGIDYNFWARDIEKTWDEFSNDENREAAWAARMLYVWQEADAAVIAHETGRTDIQLQYAKEPEKVLYARMHARELIRLAARHRGLVQEGINVSHRHLLDERIVELNKRRAGRNHS